MNKPPHLRQHSQKFIQTYYLLTEEKLKKQEPWWDYMLL